MTAFEIVLVAVAGVLLLFFVPIGYLIWCRKKPKKQVFPKLKMGDLDWSKPLAALEMLRAEVVRASQGQANWYWQHKRVPKFVGRQILICALLAGGFGIVAPLVDAAAQVGLAPWGYVALAVAAALLLIDKAFGFSTSYVRYVTTATRIETMLAKLEIEWAHELKNVDSDPDCVDRLLWMLDGYVIRVRDAVEGETNEWGAKYASGFTLVEAWIQRKGTKDGGGD
jgi:hypothetical protein